MIILMKMFEIQQMQSEALSELPLSDKKQRNEAVMNPLLGGSAPRREPKSKPTRYAPQGHLRRKDHSHLWEQTLSQTFSSPVCSSTNHLSF